MTTKHCSICGQTLPDPVAVEDAPRPEEAPVQAPFQAGGKGSTICRLCTDKLNSGRTDRTTVLRPIASQRITGKEILHGQGDADDDDAGALIIPADTRAAVKQSEKESSRPARRAPAGDAGALPARDFGSYEIMGEVSRGAFGVVYRARHQGLDRVVALKVLLAGVHASEEAVARFQREAKAVARLKHANIVPVYDIGTNQGHHYFAMEFVEGEALSTLIANRAVTTQRALEIAEALADALETAHHGGVIHRDVKPSNILVDGAGEPHITDFGLAKQVDLDTKYTMSGTTLGTPAYMPPEQARGEIEKIDARSDVYAIGAVLYEMLTGQTPFAGRSLLEVVVAVINEPVKPPRQLNPRIHRDVQTIVLKCLEKDPRQRYASAAELRDDLRRFRSGETIRARPAGIFRRAGRFVKRHSALVGGVSAALLVVGFSFYRVQESKQETKKIEAQNQNLKNELEKVKESQETAWLPYWWFPPKKPADMPTAEERKKYVIPEGKLEAYQRMPRGVKDPFDWRQEKSRPKEGVAEFQDKVVKIPGAETLVSPEECRFFGDVDADVIFTLKEWNAEKKARVGLQSLASRFDGIPYIVEIASGSVKVIGPSGLFAHTLGAESEKRNPGQKNELKLEVKAEKDAPELIDGRYTLNIHREGTYLSFRLAGPSAVPGASPGYPGLSVEIKDPNLSNWIFKNTQLVVRQPPAGLEIESAEVRRRYGGGEGGDAFSHFREGEYSVAETELKVIADGQDPFQRARALYMMGLIQEIMQSSSRRELGFYTDALNALEQMARDDAHAGERVKLTEELHFRRMVCFARSRKWMAAMSELNFGWGPDGKIGEPLAWEAQAVLEWALHEPGKDPATKDADRAAGAQAALELFLRLGLEPGSHKLGRRAAELAEALSSEGRFDDLIALQDAYESRTLSEPFFNAVGKTDCKADPGKLDLALTLIKRIGGRSESDRLLQQRAVCDLLPVAMKAKRYAESATLYAMVPSVPVLTILRDQIILQARDLAENDYQVFLTKLLPVALANLPDSAQTAGNKPAESSPAALLSAALEKVAAEIVAVRGVTKLIRLHDVLRGRTPSDPRLAASFADFVQRLAAEGDPGSDDQAIKLLKHCSSHVATGHPEIQKAVVALARGKAVVDDARSYATVIALQRIYPAPELLALARDVLQQLSKAGRYEEMVIFFSQARVEFGAPAHSLAPWAVGALEHIASSDQRAQMLANMWTIAHGEFEQRQMPAADAQWRLEFGDIQLALNLWEKARDTWQELYAARETETELRAKAGLRLGVWRAARGGAERPADALLPLLALENLPEEYKLAARLIGSPEQTRVDDLDAALKALPNPLRLSQAEWSLLRGVRLRADGNVAEARKWLDAAARAADQSRSWVLPVASQLGRAATRSPEDEQKADAEKPATKAAPSTGNSLNKSAPPATKP